MIAKCNLVQTLLKPFELFATVNSFCKCYLVVIAFDGYRNLTVTISWENALALIIFELLYVERLEVVCVLKKHDFIHNK